MAVTDASVKNRKMGGRWILSNRQRSAEISGELHHKEWNENRAGIAEIITLLELITVIERREQHIEDERNKIGFDNRKYY